MCAVKHLRISIRSNKMKRILSKHKTFDDNEKKKRVRAVRLRTFGILQAGVWSEDKKNHLIRNTERSKIHASHIKIFIDGCNSIQFDYISTYTISLWLYKSPCRSRHVVTCSHQSVSCLSTVEVQGCLFSQMQRVFIVEHCLASRSYLTCQN
jgi:hypothetical protein